MCITLQALMSFPKPGCYPLIKLLTFCLLFQEFQILSINCRLLGASSHSEPRERKQTHTKQCLKHFWTTFNPAFSRKALKQIYTSSHWKLTLIESADGSWVISSLSSVSHPTNTQSLLTAVLLSAEWQRLLNDGWVLLSLHIKAGRSPCWSKLGSLHLLYRTHPQPPWPRAKPAAALGTYKPVWDTEQEGLISHKVFSSIWPSPRKKETSPQRQLFTTA